MAEETQAITGKQDAGMEPVAFGDVDDQSVPDVESAPSLSGEIQLDALQAQIDRLSSDLREKIQNNTDELLQNGDLNTKNEHTLTQDHPLETAVFPEIEEAERVYETTPLTSAASWGSVNVSPDFTPDLTAVESTAEAALTQDPIVENVPAVDAAAPSATMVLENATPEETSVPTQEETTVAPDFEAVNAEQTDEWREVPMEEPEQSAQGAPQAEEAAVPPVVPVPETNWNEPFASEQTEEVLNTETPSVEESELVATEAPAETSVPAQEESSANGAFEQAETWQTSFADESSANETGVDRVGQMDQPESVALEPPSAGTVDVAQADNWSETPAPEAETTTATSAEAAVPVPEWSSMTQEASETTPEHTTVEFGEAPTNAPEETLFGEAMSAQVPVPDQTETPVETAFAAFSDQGQEQEQTETAEEIPGLRELQLRRDEELAKALRAKTSEEEPVARAIGQVEIPSFEATRPEQTETSLPVAAEVQKPQTPEMRQAEELAKALQSMSPEVLDRILKQSQTSGAADTEPTETSTELVTPPAQKKKSRQGLIHNIVMILVTTAALGGLVFVAALVWFGNFEANEAAKTLTDGEVISADKPTPPPAPNGEPLSERLYRVGYTVNYTWRGGESGKIVRTAEMQYLYGTIRIQDPVFGRIYLLRGGEVFEIDAVSNEVTQLQDAKSVEDEYLILSTELLGELKGRDKETLHGGLYKVEIYDNYRVYTSNDELHFVQRLSDGKEFEVRTLEMGVSENFDKLPGEAPTPELQATDSGDVVATLEPLTPDDAVLGEVSAGQYLVFE